MKEFENKDRQEHPFQVIYNRTGNLSQTTKLNKEKADDFMKVSDMRRHILIVDTDVQLKKDAVSVSSDTLAFRFIEPISKLTEIRFRSKPFYTLVKRDSNFEIQIHDRAIDDKIRLNHFIDRTDYNEQFLKLLNKAVKSGLSESVFREKLGFRTHDASYGFYLGWFFWAVILNIQHDRSPIMPMNIIGLFPIHIVGNYIKGNVNPENSRPWNESFMPLVPVDKYFLGLIFLARNGKNIVIPRE